jgi:hypothetical protein
VVKAGSVRSVSDAGRWRTNVASVLCLGVLALGITFAQREPSSLQFPLFGDGHYYFAQAWSIFADPDHDLVLDDELASFGDPRGKRQSEMARGIGNALLWGPFFGVGAAWGALVSDDVRQIAVHAAWGCRAGTLFYVMLGGWLLFLLPSLAGVPRLVRLLLFAALWLGTPLWRYTFTLPLYNHGLTFFTAASLLYVVERERSGRPCGAGALGAALAAVLMTRPEISLLALPLLAGWCSPATRTAYRARMPVLAGALLFALACFAGQLFWQRASHLAPVRAGFLHLGDPQLLDVWFGPRHGYFVQQPLLIVAALALAVTLRRPERASFALACFAFGWVQASAWDVWGGFAFGARRFVPLLPLAYLTLAELSAWCLVRGRRYALPLAVVVSWSVWHGATALDLARAVAIDADRAPVETPYMRAAGLTTSLPYLLLRGGSAGLGLADAYRIAWHTVLPFAVGVTDKVDLLNAQGARGRALSVSAREPGGQAWVLPIGRTPLCGLGVGMRELPRALRVDGVAMAPAFERGEFRAFAMQPPRRSTWTRVDVAAGSPAISQWVLDSRCALYQASPR